MILRPYQDRVLGELWDWFGRHEDGNPIVKACVGAGKSLMISAACRRMAEQVAGTRSLVIVHQKELLEQNVEKCNTYWPESEVGIFSAAKNRKDLGCQITFATIGSVYKQAHRMGRIGAIHADECHLINVKQVGMWRQFLQDMRRYNPGAPCIGWTGTDFRGNGAYLTAGDQALFTGVAARVEMRELLDTGYLCPLLPVRTETRVVAEDVPTSGDDYVVHELAKITDTDELVQSTASEICELFKERKRWLVFAVTVEHGMHVRDALRARGITAEMVHAETPKVEREAMIEAFRAGRLRCMVNVGVLTTGFDVPALDAIALLRATKSPVFYVQIAGRGMRPLGGTMEESIRNGKPNCLWADFTDTTARMGPVDTIKGRVPSKRGPGEAPFKVCPECGSRNPASAPECLDCGFVFPKPELIKHGTEARGAAVLSDQLNPERDVDVTKVTYAVHLKHGSQDSMRVEYWHGPSIIAREWVALNHSGYARLKAEQWWRMRRKVDGLPRTSADAVAAAQAGHISEPFGITIDTRAKRPEILAYRWEPKQEAIAA